MTVELPSEMTVRRATEADAEVIFDVQAAHNVPVAGEANATVEDVADELVEPGFDLDTDGWLVFDRAGVAIGWGWACRKGDSDNVDVAVYTRPGHEQAAPWLWRVVQRRAAEIAQELGHDTVTIDTEVFRDDPGKRRAARDNGFAPATSFLRLRIDHRPPVPFPAPPGGLGVSLSMRDGTDEQVRRDGHAVYNEGFADHFGFVPAEYQAWQDQRVASSAHDWAQLHVAYLDGEPAAVLLRTNSFVPDDNCGYVHTLATRPTFRRQGLGAYLLRYAFAADAAAGRTGTVLHVDTDPERPALALYQAAGMRPIQIIDIWRRTGSTRTPSPSE
ncbi:GNAT family N-acetyltransferase [Micromonospora sp. BQ11]|uniref:GNAT family N-acetyltransferase n=1 Tax=Micromonospora sp. BQ11 TaxID=3452212 RepID=UPI003F8CD9D4